jgi:hypothetical protein
MRRLFLRMLVMVMALAAGMAGGAKVESVFDPHEYTAAAALTLTNGNTIAIDTKNGTTTPTLTYNKGAGDVVVNGQVVANQNNTVKMALFCFESIDIGAGVTVAVTGNLGPVLASQGSFVFNGIIRVNGAAGVGSGGQYGGR